MYGEVKIRHITDFSTLGAKHQGAILSYVDRKSKYTKLSKLENTTAEGVIKASSHILAPHTKQVHTMTFDNGKQFSGHAEMATKLNAKAYFAKPYYAWERGLNEHTNGLIRQYFPKDTDFTTITQADIQRVEDKLTSRPRKVLQYRSRSEVFFSAA
jgi:transposase, IS30 family